MCLKTTWKQHQAGLETFQMVEVVEIGISQPLIQEETVLEQDLQAHSVEQHTQNGKHHIALPQ